MKLVGKLTSLWNFDYLKGEIDLIGSFMKMVQNGQFLLLIKMDIILR
jgi:hypothetical protein